MTTLAGDLELALELAEEARRVSLAMFRGSFGQRVKPDGSPVTEADEAVERRIREILARARPDDSILGEEYGQTGTSPRRWILDPIDGTRSFVEGRTEWGSLIALEDEYGLAVGVCDMAPNGLRYFAVRDGGAFVRRDGGEQMTIGVSKQSQMTDSRCFVPDGMWLPDEYAQRSAEEFRTRARAHQPGDHPALEVAAGVADIAIFYMGGPWDLAAPALVVQEAGGRFSDFAGGANLHTGGGLFTNSALHEQALSVLAEA